MKKWIRKQLRQFLLLDRMTRRVEFLELRADWLDRENSALQGQVDHISKAYAHILRTAETAWARLDAIQSTKNAAGVALSEFMDQKTKVEIDEQRLRHRVSAAQARGMSLDEYDVWVSGRALRKAEEVERWNDAHGMVSDDRPRS